MSTTPSPVPPPPARRLLHAFVDESGQRAFSKSSSDYFLMSAVVVADEHLADAAALLANLRRDLGRRPGDALHWKNIKSHSARVHAARTIGGATFLTVSSVVICKRKFPAWVDDNQTYLNTLELLLQRLSWLARDNGGVLSEGVYREGLMTYTVAHIVRFELKTLRRLEAYLKGLPKERIAWSHIDPRGGRIEQPSRVELLQLADLVVSSTALAFEPDRFGNLERCYLEATASRLYRRGTGHLSSYGLKVYPSCGPEHGWIDTL